MKPWQWVRKGHTYWRIVQGGFVQEKAPASGIAVLGQFIAWNDLVAAKRKAKGAR